MRIEIELTEQEIKDLKGVKNYFGKHDVTIVEHKNYDVINNLLKKINNEGEK